MDILELLEHVISHSIADTLYLIPFLFVTYVAMEWIEHKTGLRTQAAIRRAGVAGPAIGAISGIVPQCGFSAAAATLYAGRVITLGTLFAVFLSTSDEMIPIFLAQKVDPMTTISILGTKVLVGMVAGFAIDLVMRFADLRSERLRIHELCAEDNCGCEEDCVTCMENPELVYEHCQDCPPACEHDHHEHEHDNDKHHGWKHIFKSSLVHTLKIIVFIFVITLVLNLLLETVGEEALGDILGGDSFGSIALSALVGLIPNCAASIVIAQLYVEGVLGPAAMMSGLLVSAGIGILVLCRTNRDWQQNVGILAGLYAIGIGVGLVVMFAGITF